MGNSRSEDKAPQDRLPVVPLSLIRKRQKAILEDPTVIGAIGTIQSGDRFEELARAIHACFPKKVPFANVYASLSPLATREITLTELKQVSWRLAANVIALARGPVHAWHGQPRPEWSLVQATCVDPCVNFFGEAGARIDLRILSGSAAGMSIRKFWTVRFATAISRMLGFGKPWGKLPFAHITQLYGMRWFVRLVPELSRERPDFDRVDVGSGQHDYNTRLLKRRAREEDDPARARCRLTNKDATVNPCHLCLYGADQCPMATHARTFIRAYCKVCDKSDAWFDPEFPRRDICRTCWQEHEKKQATGRKGKNKNGRR